MQLVLDGQLFQVFDAESSNMTRTFVPTLRPIDAAGKFDSSVFKEFDLGDRVKMYTLLMDGAPVNQFLVLGENPVAYQKGAALAITDKFFGEDYLITWQIYHGLAIAEAPILLGITNEDLQNNGFIANGYQSN